MKEYEALITQEVNLILPKGLSKGAMPLDFVAKNSSKPFLTFGVPKAALKILKRFGAKTISLPDKKERFPKMKAFVQSPDVGGIIDLFDNKEDCRNLFDEGIYVMTLEEAVLYKNLFGSNFFTMFEEEKEMVRIVEKAYEIQKRAEKYKCFFMKDELGNCNDFVSSDFQSDQGIVLSLKEAVEYQKGKNKPILVYDTTDKDLVEYFVSIGGQISDMKIIWLKDFPFLKDKVDKLISKHASKGFGMAPACQKSIEQLKKDLSEMGWHYTIGYGGSFQEKEYDIFVIVYNYNKKNKDRSLLDDLISLGKKYEQEDIYYQEPNGKVHRYDKDGKKGAALAMENGFTGIMKGINPPAETLIGDIKRDHAGEVFASPFNVLTNDEVYELLNFDSCIKRPFASEK